VDAGWPRVIQGKGRGVADIQGSEHAAKTLIVVNCQHIADINHKEYTERDFEISEKFLKGKNPTGLRSRRRFFWADDANEKDPGDPFGIAYLERDA
jgi:hypothetical protein